MQATGPAEAVDVGERKPERTRQPVDVARDAQRVPVGGRIALVDDVRERLERAQRLPLQAPEPKLGLVEGDREGDKDDDVPRMSDRQQRGRCAEARFAGARAQAGLEVLARPHHVDEEGAHGQVGEGERDHRDQVVE